VNFITCMAQRKPRCERDVYTLHLVMVLASSKSNGSTNWLSVLELTQLTNTDDFLRPARSGVAGELYLCGVQLADGYCAAQKYVAYDCR